jgi:hypothetical protein
MELTMTKTRTCHSDLSLIGRRVSFFLFGCATEHETNWKMHTGRVIGQSLQHGLYRVSVPTFADTPVWVHATQLLDWEVGDLDQ